MDISPNCRAHGVLLLIVTAILLSGCGETVPISSLPTAQVTLTPEDMRQMCGTWQTIDGGVLNIKFSLVITGSVSGRLNGHVTQTLPDLEGNTRTLQSAMSNMKWDRSSLSFSTANGKFHFKISDGEEALLFSKQVWHSDKYTELSRLKRDTEDKPAALSIEDRYVGVWESGAISPQTSLDRAVIKTVQYRMTLRYCQIGPDGPGIYGTMQRSNVRNSTGNAINKMVMALDSESSPHSMGKLTVSRAKAEGPIIKSLLGSLKYTTDGPLPADVGGPIMHVSNGQDMNKIQMQRIRKYSFPE